MDYTSRLLLHYLAGAFSVLFGMLVATLWVHFLGKWKRIEMEEKKKRAGFIENRSFPGWEKTPKE